MDQCVHPLPLSGSCDQHRDKRRLGHCSTHQVRGSVSNSAASCDRAGVTSTTLQIVTSDCHSQ